VHLGDYDLTVVSGTTSIPCGRVTVLPKNAAVKLFPFDPAGTYDFEPITEDVANGSKQHIDTVRLHLRGSGFQTQNWGENRITIDGVQLTVNWDRTLDDCQTSPSVATSGEFKVVQTHGFVAGEDRIELCRVPVRRGSVIRVAVSQPGLAPSDTQTFRI